MELIQEPESKSTYDKCKYTVKLWEHKFKQKHGRLPSKLDIREADSKVRNAYKTYFKLKSAALEESFVGVDGFNSDEDDGASKDSLSNIETVNKSILKPVTLNIDNNEDTLVNTNTIEDAVVNTNDIEDTLVNMNTDQTWGKHLNYDSSKKKQKVDTKEETDSINLKISQKLFHRVKLNKKNSKKSLSFHHRKSESNFENVEFFSQPSTSSNSISESAFEINSFSEDACSSFNETVQSLFNAEIKIANYEKEVSTQPLNIIQTVLNKNYAPSRTIDSGWLERVSQSVGDGYTNSDLPHQEVVTTNVQHSATKFDSDSDIIDTSDNENTHSQNILHISKKLKSCQVVVDNKSAQSSESSICTSRIVSEENLKDSKNLTDQTLNTHPKISTRSRTKRVNMKELSDSDDNEKDPFQSDNDSDDPEFTLQEKNKKNLTTPSPKNNIIPTEKKSSRKISQKKSPKNQNIDNESSSYELEYSIKSRIQSVPRIKDIKKVFDKLEKKTKTEIISTKIKDKRQLQKEKLEKKVQSGTLNENFIKIDLKKKIYVKGKKTMTFSKYKKQMWKNKKKALSGINSGCDGGVLLCFHCNKPGHFARQCKETKGDALLPLQKEDEEACPFPTLEEAAQMASESVLSVRKSKLNRPVNDEKLNEQTEDQIFVNDESIFNDEDDEALMAETERLEKYIGKLNLQQYLDSTKLIEPIYKRNDDGSLIETPQEVADSLNKFGYDTFRPGQEQAIMRILSGLSTLVTLSTGSGKSLCYQIPAYLYSQKQPCITLVISPLVSLMEDQVTGIPSFLKAACLHTNQTKIQREKVMDAIKSGNVSILLVSPEAVVAGEKQGGFGSLLRQLPPIAFACIDEVHCLSQWSHNFRPSYLMISRVLHDRLGVNTILGLTATATKATKHSIIEHLRIPDGFSGIISDVPLPDNLTLNVSRDLQRDLSLVKLLSSERFVNCKSIIIYCTRRDECERLATYLRTCLKQESCNTAEKKRKRIGVLAEPYHAGLSAGRRKSIQKNFMNGELKIVVATVAFGMGINKSDIRAVIHYNMPKNFESYVQEVGRAGRDGLPAYCHLFLDAQGRDENELQRHIHANSVDRHVIRKLLQKIFIPCSCKNSCPKHEVAFPIQDTVQALDVPEEIISTLLCYLELHEKRYIEVLSPAYTHCKIISYGGPMQIRKAAKDCPPLAMALALHGKENMEENILEFPVVDIASTIGWDSGICKHKLKNLEWTSEDNKPKRSLLSVQFTDLGFRMLAPGNLTDSQLDEALDSLYRRVVNQEKTALQQLHAIYTTLTNEAYPTFKTCLTDEAQQQSLNLKLKIREYFNLSNPLTDLPHVEEKNIDEGRIVNDTRALISMYRDNSFTGRAVARIFHGISSPNYPAVIWGKCKYWRAHINTDFHSICKIATREILSLKL